MNYYDMECAITGNNACLYTKPFDAESARNTDIDVPCTNEASD